MKLRIDPNTLKKGDTFYVEGDDHKNVVITNSHDIIFTSEISYFDKEDNEFFVEIPENSATIVHPEEFMPGDKFHVVGYPGHTFKLIDVMYSEYGNTIYAEKCSSGSRYNFRTSDHTFYITEEKYESDREKFIREFMDKLTKRWLKRKDIGFFALIYDLDLMEDV